jgi:para-aminobenzoate synthetase component I
LARCEVIVAEDSGAARIRFARRGERYTGAVSLTIHERPLAPVIDPYSAWLRLRGSAPSVFLDGATGGARGARSELSRRSYVLFDPIAIVRAPAGSAASLDPLAPLFSELSRRGDGEVARSLGNDLAIEPRFRGGAAGFIAYDAGRAFESMPATAATLSAAPDLWFGIFDRGIEFDLASGAATWFAVETRGGDIRDAAAAERVFAAGERVLTRAIEQGSFQCGALRSNFTRERYHGAVAAILEHILDGDVYQLNLSQRFEAPFRGDFTALYGALREANPAPMSAVIDTGEVRILSSSPELFLARDGDRVETRPIKGTRRRTFDPVADAAAEADLMASAKERCELAMVIDLERNDLSKNARVGSVRVRDEGRLERYAAVVHRTAIVDACLEAGTGAPELLRATFPGGSITGVPKIRAMQIIEELEGVRRQVFTGAIGFIGFDGALELSIAIRTLVAEADRVHFHVGGGVVLASEANAEYEETLHKGSALARALGCPFPPL